MLCSIVEKFNSGHPGQRTAHGMTHPGHTSGRTRGGEASQRNQSKRRLTVRARASYQDRAETNKRSHFPRRLTARTAGCTTCAAKATKGLIFHDGV